MNAVVNDAINYTHSTGIALEELKILCTGLAVIYDIFLQHFEQSVHNVLYRTFILRRKYNAWITYSYN